MKINSQSSSALIWSAAFIIIAGSMLISPAGQFISYLIAAVFVLVPALFGAKRQRIAGLSILVISLFLTFRAYPQFKNGMTVYMEKTPVRSSPIR